MLVVGRLIAVTYYLMFMMSTGLASLTGSEAAQGLVLIAPATYLGVAAITGCLRLTTTGRIPGVLRSRGATILYVYVALYSVLYFPRAFSGLAAIGGTGSLLVHVGFWACIANQHSRRGRPDDFWSDLWWSMILGVTFGLLSSLAFVGGSLERGQLHNLSGVAPFVRSDLDVPFLAACVALIAWDLLSKRGASLPILGSRPPRQIVGGLLFVYAASVPILYSRRALILGLFMVISFQILPLSLKRASRRGVLFAPFVPLFWDALTTILLLVTQSSLLRVLIARNDPAEIMSASNRVTTWAESIQFLSQWRMQHLIGYGGAPDWILPAGSDWVHTHNGVLQVIFDAGIVAALLAGYLVIATLRQLTTHSASRSSAHRIALGMVVLWIILSGIEPTLRNYTIVHFTFITLLVGTFLALGSRAPAGSHSLCATPAP